MGLRENTMTCGSSVVSPRTNYGCSFNTHWRERRSVSHRSHSSRLVYWLVFSSNHCSTGQLWLESFAGRVSSARTKRCDLRPAGCSFASSRTSLINVPKSSKKMIVGYKYPRSHQGRKLSLISFLTHHAHGSYIFGPDIEITSSQLRPDCNREESPGQ